MKKVIHIMILLILTNIFVTNFVSQFNWFFSISDNKIENKDFSLSIPKLEEIKYASISEARKMDYLVPYWEFFYYGYSYESTGYTENEDSEYDSYKGLCEYIAAGMLMLYHQLFKISAFFTKEQEAEFFKFEKINRNVAIPVHKYHLNNEPEKSLILDMWKKNDKTINIKSGSTFNNILTNYIFNEKVKTNWSAGFMHSSSPEDYLIKYNVPVVLTHAYNGGHSLIVYGYDKDKEEYLVNYGFPNRPAVLIKKSDIWSFWSYGYWNVIYYENDLTQNDRKKEFEYKNKLYTLDELKEMRISVKPNKRF